jgi:phosphoribosylcarboxyaminoimidazole (NCAIR) mutase
MNDNTSPGSSPPTPICLDALLSTAQMPAGVGKAGAKNAALLAV